MGKGWIDPQLIKDITIKHDEVTNVVTTSLLVGLDRLKLHTVNFFLHSVGLFQVFYHALVVPSVRHHHHFHV